MGVSRYGFFACHVPQRFMFAMAGCLMLCPLAFGTDTLSGWGQPLDPVGDCSFDLDGGTLTVVAPGPAHGLSAELNRMTAPRVLRPIEGDFIAELQVNTDFTPGERTLAERTAYQGSGLLLMADDQTYIRIEAAVLVRGGRPRFYANFELRVDGRLQRFGTPNDFALDGERPVWLRLERRGDQILGAVTQEPGKWNYLQAKSTPLPEQLQLGVAAINASSKPLVAIFTDLQVFTPHVEPTPTAIAPPVASETAPPATMVPAAGETILEPVPCPPCCPQTRPLHRSRSLFRR